MHLIQLNQDIRPLSEFRANVASFIEQVNKTNRPLVITNHGKTSVVLVNVNEYEAMMDKLELLQEMTEAERELDAGKGIPHAQARKAILSKLKNKGK